MKVLVPLNYPLIILYLNLFSKRNNPRWSNPFSPLSCYASGDLQCSLEEALAGCGERRGSLLPSVYTLCVVLLTLWDCPSLSCCSSCCALCFSACPLHQELGHLLPLPVLWIGTAPWLGQGTHSSTSLIFHSYSLPNACFLKEKVLGKVLMRQQCGASAEHICLQEP